MVKMSRRAILLAVAASAAAPSFLQSKRRVRNGVTNPAVFPTQWPKKQLDSNRCCRPGRRRDV